MLAVALMMMLMLVLVAMAMGLRRWCWCGAGAGVVLVLVVVVVVVLVLGAGAGLQVVARGRCCNSKCKLICLARLNARLHHLAVFAPLLAPSFLSLACIIFPVFPRSHLTPLSNLLGQL
jgi:hypothetical protein